MSKWNEQHLTEGRMVAYRPKLSERSRIGQVLEFDDKTAKGAICRRNQGSFKRRPYTHI
jgi:hypothetical protein